MSNNVFIIDAQEDTPMAKLEKEGGHNTILIKGVLMPENPHEFFEPLSENVFKFFDQFSNTKMEVELDYMNSMSNKLILKLIFNIHEKAKDFKVVWKCGEQDDLMKIKGMEIKLAFPEIDIVVEEN